MLKNTLCIGAILGSSLFGSTIEENRNSPIKKENTSPERRKYSFDYVSIGGYLLLMPEISLGHRVRNGSRGYDISANASSFGIGSKLSISGGYLKYFKNSDRYFGFGVEVDVVIGPTGDGFKIFVVPFPYFVVGKDYEQSFLQLKIAIPGPALQYGWRF